MPIIVIFTRADNPQKADKMLKHVQNEFEKKKNNYLFEDKKENDVKFIKLLAMCFGRKSTAITNCRESLAQRILGKFFYKKDLFILMFYLFIVVSI